MNLSITTTPVFAEVLAAQAGAGLTWRDRSRQRSRSLSLRREAVEAEPVDRASDFSAQWRGLLLQQLVRQAGVVAFHGAMAKGFAVLADGMPIAAAQQDQRRSLDAGLEVFRQIAIEIDQLNLALAACGPGAAPVLLGRRHALLLEAGHWVGGDLVLNPFGQAGLSVDGQALMRENPFAAQEGALCKKLNAHCRDAVMRAADARRIASIMISNSMMRSLAGAQVG